MSLPAGYYGSSTGPNASGWSDARSGEYQHGDIPIHIRDEFIRHQQELIPGVVEEVKKAIGEPLKSHQGQMTRFEELTKMKEEKLSQPQFQ